MTRILPAGLIVSILLINVAACSDSVPVSTGTYESLAVDGQPSEIIAFGAPATVSDRVESGDHEVLQTRFAEHRAAAWSIIVNRTTFEERDRRIREYLRIHADFPLSHYVEQFAATHLLRECAESEAPGTLESVEYHTRTLLRNGSPETKLILESLRRLRGTWSTDELQHAARISVDRGLSWAEKVCPACRVGTKAAPGALTADEHLERKRTEIVEAAAQLRELAGP